MLVTTTHNVEGKRIVEYKGLVAGEAILGANLFRDLFASINDQGAKVGACIVEGLWRQCDQIGGGERCERATGVQAGDTRGLGMRRAVLT